MFGAIAQDPDFAVVMEWLRQGFDFVLVWYVLYQLLVLIQGTRAVQLLVGLLVLVGGYFVSRDEFLGLPMTHWLFDKFIASFILLFIVLFQQDIRWALVRSMKGRWLTGLDSSVKASVAEELVRACFRISEAKMGALIVVERGVELSTITEAGIRLDAVVTWQTLFAIFNPDRANPLHDGAVVVRAGRIEAAVCFLPLTSNPRIDKALGTRHRAALGLSEATDALVLIVSEETGTVSAAVDGRLVTFVDMKEMRTRLPEWLGRSAARDGGRLRTSALQAVSGGPP